MNHRPSAARSRVPAQGTEGSGRGRPVIRNPDDPMIYLAGARRRPATGKADIGTARTTRWVSAELSGNAGWKPNVPWGVAVRVPPPSIGSALRFRKLVAALGGDARRISATANG